MTTKKSESHKHTAKTAHSNPTATHMNDREAKSYENAAHVGTGVQEQAGAWWRQMLSQAASVPDWQKQWGQFASAATEVIPLAQKQLEAAVDLMEKNNRHGAELVRKASDAAQTMGVAESQAKWMEFWISSLGAVRGNVEALMEFNSKAMTSWIRFVRQHQGMATAAEPA